MIVKRQWLKFDKQTSLYIQWKGYYLFGFIPLYLAQGQSVNVTFK